MDQSLQQNVDENQHLKINSRHSDALLNLNRKIIPIIMFCLDEEQHWLYSREDQKAVRAFKDKRNKHNPKAGTTVIHRSNH